MFFYHLSLFVIYDRNNLYLVKGDSPLSILHFPEIKLYVYASTDEILYKALVDSPLFQRLKNGECEEVIVSEGEILKISCNGIIIKENFEYSHYYGRNWWKFGSFYGFGSGYTRSSYIEDLKSIACYQGYSPDDIDKMLERGFTLEEIEEYIYCMDGEV